MKHPRLVEVLFFISLLCLHYFPNYCDIKQDASAPTESMRKVLPSGSGRIKNVPTLQDETKKINLGVESSQKETTVQSHVEYVNSKLEEKDSIQFVDQITTTESLHVSNEKIKLNEAGLKSSRLTKHPDTHTVENVDSRKQVKTMPVEAAASQNTQTEPLSDELLTQSQYTKEQPKHLVMATHASESPIDKIGSSAPEVKAMPKEALPISESEKHLEESIHQQYDGMPSFDEWKKMMLAEQEKGGQKVPSPTPPGKKISSQKRRRNYSSYECGAKIVAANTEAEGTSRILNELVDEYMLNPCKAKIWFVIELCETVQALQIELANFELFSSCPKDFVVYSSDNFPTRDWVSLGTFTAAEQRVLQSFELKQEGFGKFIKIELLSHYGEEHYCPLSVVRIFGTSMVDEYEEMETLASRPDIPDDDLDRLDIPIEDTKSTNIFGSATDAVMNIVKKAAQALGQQSVDEKQSNETSDQQNISETKICNVIDSTAHKCKDITAKDSVSSLHAFSLSPSSMHQSMFRLLHRCDQCASSHVRYYSSAQPHCRFFQAALGPVVFQTLCDWFKEHPLAIAHESPAPVNKNVPSGSFITSTTKSPPPQIMRIPSESDLTLKSLLNDTLSSVTPSEKSPTINITSIPLNINKSVSMGDKTVILQSSIKPTQTLQYDHSSMYNDSLKTQSESSKENVVPSADNVNDYLSKASVTIPEKTERSVKETISETTTVTVVEYSTTNDLLTESEEEQISKLFDASVVTSDDLSVEIVPATELPPGFKSGEEKMVDVRSEMQGKFEPIPAAGSTTAGQKESVFMRMSNRIKALEINMSLSSQYLQELSQRYRRQMDEMQRAFNRTIGTLNDTARKAAEKDLKQQEVLNSLQIQVANLSEIVELLLIERTQVFRQMIETHVGLMIIEAIIMVTIMSLCVRRISTSSKQSSLERPAVVSPSRVSKRRNSADPCTTPVLRKVKKRSNSEENLNTEVLIVKPLPVLLDPVLKIKKKNKKRNRGIQRSVSHPAVQKSLSTHLCSSSQHMHSEGCVLPNNRPGQSQSNLACENCDNNMCTEVKRPVKQRRINSIPLQNLTNGSVIGSMNEKCSISKGKEKFSFKKFLKFQKRDSI